MTKPFSPRELAARVCAVLRRTVRDLLDRGPLVLDVDGVSANVRNYTASLDSVPLQLTRTEFRLLIMFLREPERMFSRDQIIKALYGYDFEGFDRAVDSQIYNLHRKLGQAGGDVRRIRTIYDQGYRVRDC